MAEPSQRAKSARLDGESSEPDVPQAVAAVSSSAASGEGGDMHLRPVASVAGRYAVVERNGVRMRVVRPYFYEFQTHYKPRWKDWTLLDVYEREFRTSHGIIESTGLSYFATAIQLGLVRVDGQKTPPEYKVKQGEVLSRYSHRHEPPVKYVDPSKLVCTVTDDVVICNKPGSMPIHPAGSYRLNTLLFILAADRHDLGQLFTVHRLDRLTSGLVVLARHKAAARKFANAFQQKDKIKARKTYVARVRGKFPNTADALRGKQGVEVIDKGSSEGTEKSLGAGEWINVSFPLKTVDPRKGVHACDDGGEGKASQSRFQLVNYFADSNESLVKCEPLTGRTHQLRLHLQLIGFPISNDPNYGHDLVNGAVQADAEEVDEEKGAPYDYEGKERKGDDEFHAQCDEEFNKLPSPPLDVDEDIAKHALELCVGCKYKMEPMRHAEIWLHACRFRLYNHSDSLMDDFRVPLPEWAGAVDAEFWND